MTSPAPITLSFVTLDVFTTTRFLGNPLAVVFIPAALRGSVDQDTKQRIAAEFNLSETVFLHKLDTEPATDVTTREIDIFMSDKELPFAGHPTIGSASLVLHHLGWSHVNTLLTKAGPIAIRAEPGGSVRASIPHAVHIHSKVLGDVISSAPADVVAMVNDGLNRGDDEIRAAELSSPMANIVRGMTFMLVQLPSVEHLGRVSVKRIQFGRVVGLLDEGEGEGGDGFVSRYHYVVTGWSSAEDGGQHWAIRSRLLELPFEDPATGSAACTLASYLTVSKRAVPGATFAITQGVEMGRRSEITIRTVAALEGDKVKVKEVYMGGQAVVVMNGSLTL